MTQFPGPMGAMTQPPNMGMPQQQEPMIWVNGQWVPLSTAMASPPGVPQPAPVPGAMGGAPMPPPPPQQAGGPSGAQMMPVPTPPQPMPLDVEAIAAQIMAEEQAKLDRTAPFGPGLFGGGVAMPLDTGGGGYRAPTPGFSTAEFAPPLPREGADRVAGLKEAFAILAAKRGPVPEPAPRPDAEELLRMRAALGRLDPDDPDVRDNIEEFRDRQDVKFGEREGAKVPMAKRRELVMAKARGESPLETRVALGTASPEDLALMGVDLAALPEAQEKKGALQVQVARMQALASFLATSGENLSPTDRQLLMGALLDGQQGPLGAPGEIPPQVVKSVKVGIDPSLSVEQKRELLEDTLIGQGHDPAIARSRAEEEYPEPLGLGTVFAPEIERGRQLAYGLSQPYSGLADSMLKLLLPPPPAPKPYGQLEAEALGPINEARARQGLPPLQ